MTKPTPGVGDPTDPGGTDANDPPDQRFAGLTVGARGLLIGTWLAAVAATGAVLASDTGTPGLIGVLLLAGGIGLGELLRVDLPHRGGGTASFGLGDAAIAAGLVLLPPGEVVLGAIGGVVLLQFVERVPVVKFGMNLAQYALGASAAAMAVAQLTGGARLPAGPGTVGALAVGLGLFFTVNALTVGGMIALTGGRTLRGTLAALLPTGLLLASANLALAVLAVLLFDSHPWALPALAVPIALLWIASRQDVAARLERDRTRAFVDVEQRLGAARTPEEVAVLVANAVRTVLGCRGSVWHDEEWVGDVPAGSTWCPVDPALPTPLPGPGSTFGLGVAQECVAVGVDGGVLVVRPGELDLDAELTDWVARLARSARVHFARATAAVSLAQERATLREVVEGAGDGVMLLDADGVVTVWNPAMVGLSTIPTPAAVGRVVEDLLGDGPWREKGVHDVDRPRTGAIWRVGVSPVDSGIWWIVTAHDVTAERRSAQAREDMLSVVSHELRTPLTPILASAGMLRRRWDAIDDERRMMLLTQIEDRATHLTRLVEDLLLVGQMSATERGVALTITPVNLDELLGDAVEAMRLTRPRHRLLAEVGQRCVAPTDPVRLRQILDNLLDNACKFSPPGTAVIARVASEGDGVLLEVSDRGRGIPPGELERVFDQFTRVEDPLTMTTSGQGLGLYIVRELAKAMGITLEMRSQVGVGTTVTLRIPRAGGGTVEEPRPIFTAAHDRR